MPPPPPPTPSPPSPSPPPPSPPPPPLCFGAPPATLSAAASSASGQRCAGRPACRRTAHSCARTAGASAAACCGTGRRVPSLSNARGYQRTRRPPPRPRLPRPPPPRGAQAAWPSARPRHSACPSPCRQR
eukprot:7251688-Prymnesium_polylepis.1